MLEHLDEIIQKANQAGAESQEQHQQPRLQLGQAQHLRQAGVEYGPHNAKGGHNAQNKAEAAHRGGAVFLVMPGGALLADGLAKVQTVQHRDE